MHLRQRGLLATVLKLARRLPTPAFPYLAPPDRYLPAGVPTNARGAFANRPACPRHTKAVTNRACKKSLGVYRSCPPVRWACSSSCCEKLTECSPKVQSSSIRRPLPDREPDRHLPIVRGRSRCMTKGASGCLCLRGLLWRLLVGTHCQKSRPCDSPDRLPVARSAHSDRRPRLKKRFRLRRRISQYSSSFEFTQTIQRIR
jgi:hypothetical protein